MSRTKKAQKSTYSDPKVRTRAIVALETGYLDSRTSRRVTATVTVTESFALRPLPKTEGASQNNHQSVSWCSLIGRLEQIEMPPGGDQIQRTMY